MKRRSWFPREKHWETQNPVKTEIIEETNSGLLRNAAAFLMPRQNAAVFMKKAAA